MKVAFRADSSVVIGSGHVMRCLALAKKLRTRGAEVTFLCRPQPGDLIAFIRQSGFIVDELSTARAVTGDATTHSSWLGARWDDDASEVSAAVASRFGRVDWIVVDHYAIDARWERIVGKWAGHMLVIDDLADRPHHCDVLLDQNVDAGLHHRYPTLLNKSAHLLLGPRYLLLRDEFGTVSPQGSRNGNKALIFFGSIDGPGTTLNLLQSFDRLGFDLSVCALVGAANPHLADIDVLCKRANYECHVGVENVAQLIAGCDFAIAACGFFAYELMAMRTPALLTAQSEIQWRVAKTLDDLGVARAISLTDLRISSMLERGIAETRAIPRALGAFDVVSIKGAETVVTTMEQFGHAN